MGAIGSVPNIAVVPGITDGAYFKVSHLERVVVNDMRRSQFARRKITSKCDGIVVMCLQVSATCVCSEHIPVGAITVCVSMF
jgi:hypothetical protein